MSPSGQEGVASGESLPEDGFDEPCPFTVDDLLAAVDAEVVGERLDCGLGNAAFRNDVDELQRCFEEAPSNRGAAYTLIRCVDCYIAYAYVSTPDRLLYQVYMEDDRYGDQTRESAVMRCDSLSPRAGDVPVCVNGVALFSCTEPR